MAKFNLGDKAIVRSLSATMNGFEVGDEVELRQNKLGFSDFKIIGETGNHGYANEEHLKLEEEETDMRKIKVEHSGMTIEGTAEEVANFFRSMGAEEEAEEVEIINPNEFDVGDLVVAKEDNPYFVTNDKMKLGKVVEPGVFTNKGGTRVRVLTHENKSFHGDEFDVDPKYFEKVLH